ncbi:MAG: ribbon-helix-helix protein, CopG family [Thermoanaerobaculia bacterium]
MAPLKMTFSLDEKTAAQLARTAERLNTSKSAVVREAVAEYAARACRMSEAERRKTLRAFDELVPKIPRRPAAEVDEELGSLRRARRAGGRSTWRSPPMQSLSRPGFGP